MTNKRPTFKEFKKRLLQDKAVKAEYDLLEKEFLLIEKSIKEKKEARLINEPLLFKIRTS